MTDSTEHSSKRLQSFQAFWPFYVGEHRDPVNRGLHYIGTTGVLGIIAFAAFTERWWIIALLPLCGYGFAWFGHFIIEKNRPATFTYPLWSLMADFKMYGLALSGRMGSEVVRLYGSRHPEKEAPLLVNE